MTCRLEDILQAPAEDHRNRVKWHKKIGELGKLPGSLFLCPNFKMRGWMLRCVKKRIIWLWGNFRKPAMKSSCLGYCQANTTKGQTVCCLALLL